MIFGLSPIMLIVVVIMLSAVVMAAGLFAGRAIRRKLTRYFYFDRDTTVSLKTGPNAAGIVSSVDGGFVERPGAVFHMRTGRALIERGSRGYRRARRPVYLARAGDAAPMELAPTGEIQIDNVVDDEFDRRVDTAAELAVREGSKRGVRSDVVGRLLGVAILGLVALLGAVVIAGIVKNG